MSFRLYHYFLFSNLSATIILFTSLLPFQTSSLTLPQNIFSSAEIDLTSYNGGASLNLAFASLLSGSAFVATWDCYLCDGSFNGIFARVYYADGTPYGPEFKVNTYTLNDQSCPSVTDINKGTQFVISWQSEKQDGDNYGIFFKIFDWKGNNLTSDIQANIFTTNEQASPNITSLELDGSKFIIIWNSVTQDGDGKGIVARFFKSTGQSLTNEILVNEYKLNNQDRKTWAKMESDTKIIISWESELQDGSSRCVNFKIYSSTGTQICSEVRANIYTSGQQTNPSITPFLNSNLFLISWQSQGQDGSDYAVIGRIYNSKCVSVVSEFVINSYTTGLQAIPKVATLTGNKIGAVWRSDGQDGDAAGVYGRTVASDGTLGTNEFKVNTFGTGNQWFMLINELNAGAYFVVTWDSSTQDGSLRGIYSKLFAANTTSLSADTRVNLYTTGDQIFPRVMSSGLGSWHIIGWYSYVSSFFKVRARVFRPCLTIDDCCDDLSCSPEYFPCSKQSCRTISGKLISNTTDIFSSQYVNLTMNATKIYSGITTYYKFSCKKYINSIFSACEDPNSLFNTYNSSSILIIPSKYFVNVSLSSVIYQFEATMKTNYMNVSSTLNITVRNLSAYAQSLCMTSLKVTCSRCLVKVCTIPSSCSSFINSCPNCYIDSDCNSTAPVCSSSSCLKHSLTSSISAQSPTIYVDKELKLTASYTTNAAYLSYSYYWSCISNFTAIWPACPDSGMLFNKIYTNSDLTIPANYFQNITTSATELLISVNVSSQFNSSIARSLIIVIQPGGGLRDCYSDADCDNPTPICSTPLCITNTLNSNISILNQTIYVDEELNLTALYTTNAAYLPLTFVWTCMSNLTSSWTNCPDRDSLFSTVYIDPLLSIPPFYFENITINTTLLQFLVNISSPFNSSVSRVNLTIMKNIEIKPQGCANNSDCNSTLPLCLIPLCMPHLITSNISAQSQHAYVDQELNLTALFSTNGPNLSFTYSWSCQSNFTSTWTDCPDPSSIFNTAYNYPLLTIPAFYFQNITTNLIELQFSVNISSPYNSSTSQIAITMSKSIIVTVEPIFYYSTGLQYSLTAYETDTTLQLSAYIWNLFPPIPFTDSGSSISISPNFLTLQETYLKITITATSNFESRSEVLWIPIDKAPINGSLNITPLSGISLVTQYKFMALSWIDDDLPLSYRFSYTYNISSGYIALTSQFLANPELFTILSGSLNSEVVTIQLEVVDIYQAITKITNTTICQLPTVDITSTAAFVTNALNTLNDSNMTATQKASTLNLISNQIFELEKNFQNGTDTTQSKLSACPACSGHGNCTNGQCVCLTGWSFYDCSISKADFDQIIDTKLKILDSVNSLLQDPANKNDSKLTSTLMLVTSNPDFNDAKTLTKVQNILENSLNLNSPNATLTKQQAEDISKIVDSTFRYLSNYDCNASSNLSQNTLNKSSSYIDTISRSLVADTTASSNATILNQGSYSLYVKKVSVCDLSSLQLSTGSSLAPDVNISLNSSLSVNCSQTVTVQYAAVNSNLMSCNLTAPTYFSNVALKFYDDKGKKIDIEPVVTLVFKDPSFVKCSSSCSKSGLSCVCRGLDIFDFGSQMQNIFSASQLKNIFKFGSLVDFDFLASVPFWILTFFVVSTLLFVAIVIPLEEYDGIKSYLKTRSKSKLKRLLLTFCAVQSFLQIIFVKDKLPKTVRAYLYYIRMIIILTHASIFGLKEVKNTQTIQEKISSFSWFNPYLLLLPYLTVLPTFMLLNWLLTKAWDIPKSRKNSKLKKYFAVGFTLAFTITCNLFIIVITANLSSDMISQWVFNFVLLQTQDIFVFPIISIIVINIKACILNSNVAVRFPKLREILMSDGEKRMMRLNHRHIIKKFRVKRMANI